MRNKEERREGKVGDRGHEEDHQTKFVHGPKYHIIPPPQVQYSQTIL